MRRQFFKHTFTIMIRTHYFRQRKKLSHELKRNLRYKKSQKRSIDANTATGVTRSDRARETVRVITMHLKISVVTKKKYLKESFLFRAARTATRLS